MERKKEPSIKRKFLRAIKISEVLHLAACISITINFLLGNQDGKVKESLEVFATLTLMFANHELLNKSIDLKESYFSD